MSISYKRVQNDGFVPQCHKSSSLDVLGIGLVTFRVRFTPISSHLWVLKLLLDKNPIKIFLISNGSFKSWLIKKAYKISIKK